ncbi:MAG: hypothetical protein V7609_2808 [Verrucomicrobiota bacterium]
MPWRISAAGTADTARYEFAGDLLGADRVQTSIVGGRLSLASSTSISLKHWRAPLCATDETPQRFNERENLSVLKAFSRMSLSPEELQFRPFQPLPFGQPSPDEIVDGVVREADAHAALQTRLAVDGVDSITPDTAESLLATFGVAREGRRAILRELWQHAFKKLLFRDDQVDSGEASYLNRLKLALGLTDREVERARSEVPKLD